MECNNYTHNREFDFKFKIEDIKDVTLNESCTKPFHILDDKYKLHRDLKLDEIKEEHKQTSIVKELVSYTNVKEFDHYCINGEASGKNEKNISNDSEINDNKHICKNEINGIKSESKYVLEECDIKEQNIVIKELVCYTNIKEIDHYVTKNDKYDKYEQNNYDTDKIVFDEGLSVADTIKCKFYDLQKDTFKELSERYEIKDSNTIVKKPADYTDDKEEKYDNHKIYLNKDVYGNEEVEYKFEIRRFESGKRHMPDECGISESNYIVKQLVTHRDEQDFDHYTFKEEKYDKNEKNKDDNNKSNFDKCFFTNAVDTIKYDIVDNKFKNTITELPEEYEIKDSKCTNNDISNNNFCQRNLQDNIVTDFTLFEKRNTSKNKIVNRLKKRATQQENEHEKEKKDTFECADCGNSFTTRNKLTDHMRKHRTFMFNCSNCHYSTTNKSTLVRHSRTHFHKSQRTRKICLVCQSSFSNQPNLNRHMKIHSQERARTFKCLYCNFTCTSRYILKNHIATHTGERPYQCSICCFSTARRYTLVKHLQLHDGYQCEICKTKLVSSKKLKSHLEEVHNLIGTEFQSKNTKPNHKCTVCGKSYLHKCRLEVHMQTHSGKRPFTCADCQQGFATKCTLRSHISVVHLNTPMNCSYCEFTSFSKLILRKHVQLHRRNRFNCAHCSFSTDLRHCIGKHVRVHINS